MYSEPHRHYHTREHILKCLNFFEKIKQNLVSADTVELAILYHDVIYEIGAKDNEARSARLFQQHAEGYLTDNFIDQVKQLILATMHSNPPINSDAAYLQDIDLCSFGETWGNFVKDGNNLREESPGLSDEDYDHGKITFFQMLLNRERIFFTDYFYSCYEDIARRNIRLMMHKMLDND